MPLFTFSLLQEDAPTRRGLLLASSRADAAEILLSRFPGKPVFLNIDYGLPSLALLVEYEYNGLAFLSHREPVSPSPLLPKGELGRNSAGDEMEVPTRLPELP